ncbi:Uncharacterized protein OBRU01_20877 [Operophtera brumata]|uniref:DDE Tnp4 domain-containing protein n=1 Tax=Operophtera brumata TaxID=104452 RepID=A0A0L7KUI2_OPEBR|nr:Uncharacterized protein OBRU01_20877 [Operophtera brumata]
MNYRALMPMTKNAGATQLTTQQANQSRRVTLCKWVVETVNGRLKNRFRQLRSTFNNRAASHLFDEVKIAGALLNAFGKPLTDHPLV